VDSFGPIVVRLIIGLPIFVSALVLHEVAHGYAAYRLGDDTAKRMGRLTFSPLAHLDAAGTLMFVISSISGFGFGWAKAVPVDVSRLRHPRRDDVIVSLAGVTANLAQGLVWGLLAWGLYQTVWTTSWGRALGTFCAFGVAINLIFMLFNLLPIPPLDGSHVAARILGFDDPYLISRLAPVGFIVLLLFLRSSAYDRFLGLAYFPVLERALPLGVLYELARLLSG
jgi:Zn-dependent protease